MNVVVGNHVVKGDGAGWVADSRGLLQMHVQVWHGGPSAAAAQPQDLTRLNGLANDDPERPRRQMSQDREQRRPMLDDHMVSVGLVGILEAWFVVADAIYQPDHGSRGHREDRTSVAEPVFSTLTLVVESSAFCIFDFEVEAVAPRALMGVVTVIPLGAGPRPSKRKAHGNRKAARKALAASVVEVQGRFWRVAGNLNGPQSADGSALG